MGRRIACLAVALLVAAGLAGVAEAKTLVYCAEGSPAGFDPALHTDPATLDASSQAIYNRLVQFKPGTAEIVPALAESWEISKDGREYTFRLRPGVRFHTTADFTPARPFNADDVLFSFERQWRADHPWHDYAGDGGWPWFDGMSLATVLQDIRKVDDSTVTFVLQRPYAPFLANLAMDFASILSKEYADHLLVRRGARAARPCAGRHRAVPSGRVPSRHRHSLRGQPGLLAEAGAARQPQLRDHPRQRRPLREAQVGRVPGHPVAQPRRPRRHPGGRRAGASRRRGARAELSRLQHDRAALRPGARPPRRGARHRQGGHRRRCLQGRRGRGRRPASAADGGRRRRRLGAV